MELFPVIGTWAFDPAFLGRRMSFISGPRQVGKTTLALGFLERIGQTGLYYNWDTISVRRKFAQNPLFFLEGIPEPPPPTATGEPKYWVVFDEFHKHPKWKDLLKGFHDEFRHFIRFVVCGSARLDVYRKGGESLLGRYFMFRTFPLSPKDIVEGEKFHFSRTWNPNEKIGLIDPSAEFKEAVFQIYNLTGFPEPFLAGSKEFYMRWRDEHFSLLTTEEIRDLSRITDIVRLQTLAFLLPERVGSLLSLNNLAKIVSVSHATVVTWLDAMEQVYLIFRIPPYSTRLARAIRKNEKLYFWDWGMIEDPGKRFENFLAVQLLRAVSAWKEWGWGNFSLNFVRTKDGREADFLVTKDRKPWILVEAKVSDSTLDRNLLYFKEALGVKLAFQVLLEGDLRKQITPGVFVTDVGRFLKLLV